MVVLMGVLKFWEGQGNCLLGAPALLLNRESFPIISFRGRKRRGKEWTFKCLFCYLCVAHRWVRDNFEFAVDTFALLDSVSASYSGEQTDEEWIPQVENEQHRRIQTEFLV